MNAEFASVLCDASLLTKLQEKQNSKGDSPQQYAASRSNGNSRYIFAGNIILWTRIWTTLMYLHSLKCEFYKQKIFISLHFWCLDYLFVQLAKVLWMILETCCARYQWSNYEFKKKSHTFKFYTFRKNRNQNHHIQEPTLNVNDKELTLNVDNCIKKYLRLIKHNLSRFIYPKFNASFQWQWLQQSSQ